MTKREFVKLKIGDILLAIRHLLNDKGEIVISENSEWRVEKIEHMPSRDQAKKAATAVQIMNPQNGQIYTIYKDNSTNFLVYKRKRGPVPKHSN